MSNAIGTIVFGKSKGCVYDGEKLALILSQYEWISDGSNEWEYSDYTDSIYLEDAFETTYPSLYPSEVIGYKIEDDDGNEIFKRPSEMSEEDFDAVIEVIDEGVDFKALVKDISNCISHGSIELVMTCTLGQRYAKIERMHIDCNGNGSRTNTYIGSSCGLIEMAEHLENGVIRSYRNEK